MKKRAPVPDDYLWFHTVGIPYTWDPDRRKIIFEDGTEYTLEEALILSKGNLKADDIMRLHNVKKETVGELIPPPWLFDHSMPEHIGKMPEASSVSVVRPVRQQFYGRRKTASPRNYVDPGQGVLNL